MKHRDLLGWGTLRTALMLLFIGGIMLLAGIDVFVICAIRSPDQLTRLRTSIGTLGILSAGAGGGIMLLGLCLGTAVPRRTGARLFAWAAFCAVLALALARGLAALAAADNAVLRVHSAEAVKSPPKKGPPPRIDPWPPEAIQALQTASAGAMLVALIFFALLMWRVCVHLAQRALAVSLLVSVLILAMTSLAAYAYVMVTELRFVPWELASLGLVGENLIGIAFLVQFYLVRRAISRAVLAGGS
jgi:hypothetical protein